MPQVSLDKINQVCSINLNKNNNKTTLPVKQKEEQKDKRQIKLALEALAVAGVVVAAGIAIYKHKKLPVQIENNSPQALISQLSLSDINFNKGVAFINGSEAYTGIVQDNLKNGDKIVLEYVDGVIKKSSRTGSKDFKKLYLTLNDGSKVVATTQGNNSITTNVTEIQNEVNKALKELEDLLSNEESLSLEEFQKLADSIEYKTPALRLQINDVISKKEKLNRYKDANYSQNDIDFAQNFEQTKEAVKSLLANKEGYQILIKDGEIVSSNQELNDAMKRILQTFPDFKKLDEENITNALKSFLSVAQHRNFEKLSLRDKKIALISTLLQDCAIKDAKSFRADWRTYRVLDLSRDISRNLTTDDEKTIFDIVNFIKRADNGQFYDMPLFSYEKELDILKIISEAKFEGDTGTISEINRAIEKNYKLIDLSDTYGQLIYATPFNPDVALKNQESCFETKILRELGDFFSAYSVDLSKLPDTADVSKYGFPKGTTKKDLRFYVHMFSDDFAGHFDYKGSRFKDTVLRSKSYNTLWSKSFISPDYQKTFFDRRFGFITAPKIGQMHITYVDGRKSGYDKKITMDLSNILNNKKETDRLNALPNFVKEALHLSDEEYKDLFKQLKTMGNIFEPAFDETYIQIGTGKLTINEIREAVKKSQDELFKTIDTRDNSENNEIVDETCDILGLIVKGAASYDSFAINECLKSFLDETGRMLPIFII